MHSQHDSKDLEVESDHLDFASLWESSYVGDTALVGCRWASSCTRNQSTPSHWCLSHR